MAQWLGKVNCWLLYWLLFISRRHKSLDITILRQELNLLNISVSQGKICKFTRQVASSFTLLGPMFMVLGLGLDNISTMKCWPSCLIITQYYSSLPGNCHYNADQAGRPAYGDVRAQHLLTFHTDQQHQQALCTRPYNRNHRHRHWKFCGKPPVSGDGLETFTPWLLQ